MSKALEIASFVLAPLAWGLLVELIFHHLCRARARRRDKRIGGGQ